MKIATLNVFKIFVLCILVLLPNGSTNEIHTNDQNLIKVGEVTNEIRMGKFAGNRNLAIGIENILEEIILEYDYDLYDGASKRINVKLVFFDIKNMGASIAVYRKGVSLTQIAAIGELVEDGKVIKTSKQKGSSKQISTTTLVIAEDGKFNQQTASIALKRVCEAIIKDLLE